MKPRRPFAYLLLMAFAGALGGFVLAWGTPSAPPGRLILLCAAMGCVVAAVSHVLLWRNQPFRVQRTLTPVFFFTWWGAVAEALSRWFSKP